MAQDNYGPEDRAELIAEGLGIKPSSYAGRTADATAAMALVAGYSRMARYDQVQVLYTISERMKFGTTNPDFVNQCRQALALMIYNPGWVPGSLSNDELEKDIAFWRNVKSTLDFFGAPAATTYVASKTPGIFKSLSAGTMPQAPSVAAAGPLVFVLGARAVTTGSLSDLEAEAKRRGQLGTMTQLHAERFGPKK